INAARTLAASHNKQRREIFVQPKFLARDLPIQSHQFSPDRRAGDLRVRFGKKGAHSLKPSMTAFTIRAVNRFAFPGMAFDSWMKVGIPRIRPANTGAVDVNPPMPRTT